MFDVFFLGSESDIEQALEEDMEDFMMEEALSSNDEYAPPPTQGG